MDYTIGQVSKLLGLSIEGIRNYEKSGIIRARRSEGSSYRKFGYLDITSLIRARMYRSLGCSIHETGILTNDSTIEEVHGFLEARRQALKREIDLAEHKVRHIERIERTLFSLENELGKVRIGESPAIYRFEFSKNGVVDFSEPIISLFQNWMELMPFVYISSRYHGDDVFGGLAISEENAALFEIIETEYVKYHSAALSLRMTVMEADNGYSDASILQPMLEYAERHRFRFCGDQIGHTVIGINKSSGYKRCRRVYAPIEEI